jgi:hypothetical protein
MRAAGACHRAAKEALGVKAYQNPIPSGAASPSAAGASGSTADTAAAAAGAQQAAHASALPAALQARGAARRRAPARAAATLATRKGARGRLEDSSDEDDDDSEEWESSDGGASEEEDEPQDEEEDDDEGSEDEDGEEERVVSDAAAATASTRAKARSPSASIMIADAVAAAAADSDVDSAWDDTAGAGPRESDSEEGGLPPGFQLPLAGADAAAAAAAEAAARITAEERLASALMKENEALHAQEAPLLDAQKDAVPDALTAASLRVDGASASAGAGQSQQEPSTAVIDAGCQPNGGNGALAFRVASVLFAADWTDPKFLSLLERIVRVGCAGGGLDAVKLLGASAVVCKAWKEVLMQPKFRREAWRNICRFPLPAPFTDEWVKRLCLSGAWLLVDELRWLDCNELTSKALASVNARKPITEADKSVSPSPAHVTVLEWAGCAEPPGMNEARALLAKSAGALRELRLHRAGAGTRVNNALLVALLADISTHGSALRVMSLAGCPWLSAQLISEHLESCGVLEELDISGSGANMTAASALLPFSSWSHAWPELRALRMNNYPANGTLRTEAVDHDGVFAKLQVFEAEVPCTAPLPRLQLTDDTLRSMLSGSPLLTHLVLSGHGDSLKRDVLRTALHPNARLHVLRLDRTQLGDSFDVRGALARVLVHAARVRCGYAADAHIVCSCARRSPAGHQGRDCALAAEPDGAVRRGQRQVPAEVGPEQRVQAARAQHQRHQGV